MAKKSDGVKKEPKKAAPKKSADTITIRCGNDECMLKDECRRYNPKCEVKLVCRRRKCEHFLGK